MLETVRIRRAGYPIRFTPADFVKRYYLLVPKFKRNLQQKALRALNISKSILYESVCSDM
jgi:myosin-7